MPTRKTIIVVSLIAVLLGAGFAGAIGRGRLIGVVEDPEGNPVEGVTVRATSQDVPGYSEVVVTDAKGVFKLDFDEINVVYTYQFSKPGYVTVKTEQTWRKDGKARHSFTIYPGDDPVVDDAAPMTESADAATAYNAGVAAFDADDLETAESRFAEAVEHDPELRQAWVALGLTALQRGHYEKAVEASERAIELGSTNPLVLRNRWEAYRQLGDEAKTAEAQADLERIGELSEEAKRIYNEGVKLLKQGDKEGAFAKFQESLSADSNLREALFAVATTGLETGHYEEAFDAAEEILKEDPGDAEAIKLRYNAALQIGDEGLIIGSLVGLATVMPEVAQQNLWHLAMAAYNANDMDVAMDRFQIVLRLDPNNAQAHYLLGLIHLGELDSQAETQQHLERFLELAPDDPDAPAARDILSYLQKR